MEIWQISNHSLQQPEVQTKKRYTDSRPNDITPNDIQPNDIKPNDIKPNDIKPNDINPNATLDRTTLGREKKNYISLPPLSIDTHVKKQVSLQIPASTRKYVHFVDLFPEIDET